MNRKLIISLVGASALFLVSCRTTEESKGGEDVEDLVLVPEGTFLNEKQIAQLENMSKKGDCDATYRLFEYYGYNTSYHLLALHYAELALEQGCEKAADDVRNMKKALGFN